MDKAEEILAKLKAIEERLDRLLEDEEGEEGEEGEESEEKPTGRKAMVGD